MGATRRKRQARPVAAPPLRLQALALSSAAFVSGVPAAGTILGATSGSAIVAAGLPAGLTIDGAARTWSWDGSGSVSAGSLSLTESHPSAHNSPRVNAIGWSVTAPPVAISSEFPILKAAYESGQRALIAGLGDSTWANLETPSQENSLTQYLGDYLAGKGLAGVIQGCFTAADRGFSVGGHTLAQYAAYYMPDAAYDAAFTAWETSAYRTAFGVKFAVGNAAGTKIRFDPGFAYDRAEVFYNTFPGAKSLDIKIGATTIANYDLDQALAFRKSPVLSFTRTATPIDQVVASGSNVYFAGLRVWDSTASRILQIEPRGVAGFETADWLNDVEINAGATIPIIGAHLYVVYLGYGEMNLGTGASTFQSRLTSLVSTLKATGGPGGGAADVLVCQPSPSKSGTTLDQAHRDAIDAACAAAGVGAPVNLYSGIGWNAGIDQMPAGHASAAGNFRIVNGISGLGGLGARILGLS